MHVLPGCCIQFFVFLLRSSLPRAPPILFGVSPTVLPRPGYWPVKVGTQRVKNCGRIEARALVHDSTTTVALNRWSRNVTNIFCSRSGGRTGGRADGQAGRSASYFLGREHPVCFVRLCLPCLRRLTCVGFGPSRDCHRTTDRPRSWRGSSPSVSRTDSRCLRLVWGLCRSLGWLRYKNGVELFVTNRFAF